MRIRSATVADVPAMGQIINDAAEYGLMLHRSLSHLYEHVREFHVAEDDDRVVGVCGLKVVWGNLGEIYALAVRASHRRRGLGRQLTEACIEDARRLAVPRLMVLTYEQRFFEALGFTVCDRQKLPLKVWSECLRCAKNQACDEIAMVRTLQDVSATTAPPAAAPPPGTYEVPVTLGNGLQEEPPLPEAQPTPKPPGPIGRRKKMDEAH